MNDPARDRETVRRALWAGAAAWLLATVGLAIGAVVRQGALGPEAAVLVVIVGLILGGIAATLWLMLANVLDLLAGEPPGLRRWLWTAGLLLLSGVVVPATSSVLAS